MSRAIKFRAWDTVEGRWIEPQDLSISASGWPLVWNAERECFRSRVQTVVLMQFTGLHDNNGKEIYEGDAMRFDIVELQGGGKPIKDVSGEVRWDDEDAGFYFLSNTDAFPHVKPWHTVKLEVIGNVFEHPELLEATK